ncbi:nitrous oxidase accessory protein NosD [Sulfurimonas gotlandica GD1]|jgi:nitrous oxidase accessory protein|uniref:Nitrous oxidase accessory protein NosD n=1 Tax=Sulfurimonas gotlandica (strain DSM 19862 / JCM 16533 / GD1) TaxID=929558 RepID=B6BMM9_SULGG|nr:nitrous oxide reductase family maturation protein NosD [Sulfurimonas gotlandica]EDZ61468.1 periplasmic copper-binding [Sulfurimonas gotlandica GD1]EHP30854.1 nitrous oxidase accessory protein NosD [Sulfurimonas gotlandica GD1]
MKKLLLFIYFISALNASILQETIDSAPSGATLKLPAGIYKGNIIINKPITLLGKEDGVIIDGGGIGKVITINSSNVTIENLTITNSGTQMHQLDSAIFINKSKNSQISNCKILNSLYGIDMLMVEDSNISNNFITSKNNDIGLRGDALKIWHSHNNTISNNTIDRVRDVTMNYSNNNILENNHILNSRFGLQIAHSKNNLIKENEFRYNSVSLMLMMTQNTKITNNSIQSSKGAAGIGVMLKGGHNILFEYNTLRYNAKAMYIDSKWTEMSMKRYIVNNEISYNKEAIHFHLTIRNNTFTHNEFVGNIDDIVKSTAGFETKSNVVEYNYWDRYAGFDTNGDNIGDTSHKMYQYADRLWHYNNKVKFFYGSPVMTLLNFLAQVAPFIDPILMLEDKKPIVNPTVSMDALKD